MRAPHPCKQSFPSFHLLSCGASLWLLPFGSITPNTAVLSSSQKPVSVMSSLHDTGQARGRQDGGPLGHELGGVWEDARTAGRTGNAHIMVSPLGQRPETSRLCPIWVFILFCHGMEGPCRPHSPDLRADPPWNLCALLEGNCCNGLGKACVFSSDMNSFAHSFFLP